MNNTCKTCKFFINQRCTRFPPQSVSAKRRTGFTEYREWVTDWEYPTLTDETIACGEYVENSPHTLKLIFKDKRKNVQYYKLNNYDECYDLLTCMEILWELAEWEIYPTK